MFKTLALTAALSLAAGSAAFASPLTATLQSPVAKAGEVIAGGAAWNCADTTCVATSTSAARAMSVESCHLLGREVGGPVAAYGPQAGGLSASELARCNRGFKTAAPTQTAQSEPAASTH